MADIARPALAEVLAALTHEHGSAFDVAWWRANGIRSGRPFGTHGPISREGYGCVPWLTTPASYEARRVGNTLTRVEVAPAHTITPAEAVEAIAGLWPWEPGDDPTRWWCDRCGCVGAVTARGGRGGQVIRGVRCDCAARSTTREECDRTGEEYVSDLSTPPTLVALVAVASLGAGQLARYVALAGEIARVAGCAGARVVWRVMGREAIVAWAMDRRGKTCRSTADLVVAMAVEGVLNPSYLALPHAMPWAHALRSLAVGEDATPKPTGVHLVALDTSRIVLAVEAIGGDRG